MAATTTAGRKRAPAGMSTPNIFTIDVDEVEVEVLIEKVLAATSEISLLAFLEQDVEAFFHADIQNRFNDEGDAKSGPWEPLQPATINIRQSLGFGDGPINVRTGELKEFLLGDYDSFAGLGWAEMNVPGDPKDPVTARKLETAQRGNPSNPIPNFGPTPPRPVLALAEVDMWRLLEMLQIHIIHRVMGSVIV